MVLAEQPLAKPGFAKYFCLPEVVDVADVYIVRAVQDASELTCTIIA